ELAWERADRRVRTVGVTASKPQGAALGHGANDKILLRCMSPLLAQSGHAGRGNECLLLGVKRTLMNHTMRQRALLVFRCLALAQSKERGRCLLTKLGFAQFTARLFWRLADERRCLVFPIFDALPPHAFAASYL